MWSVNSSKNFIFPDDDDCDKESMELVWAVALTCFSCANKARFSQV